jgi:tRNA (guanine37-N1)-methyltransferase
MKFEIVTLFPELIEVYKKNGIIGRAVENKLFELEYVFLRDYSQDKHKKVDDYPYGGGPGMLLKPEPMFRALDAIKKHNSYIIIFVNTDFFRFSFNCHPVINQSRNHLTA